MKVSRFLVLCFVLVCSLSLLGIWDVEAASLLPKNSGDICWLFQDEGHSGDSWVIKFTAFKQGKGNYFLSGLNTFEGEVLNGHGNAVENGNSIIITIHASGVHSWGKSANTIHMTLDSSTLNGSYFSLAHEIENDGVCDVGAHCLEYYHGTVTYMPCP